MPPTQKELLKVAGEFENRTQQHRVKINKAVVEAGTIDITPGLPAEKLDLTLTGDDDDPFYGNQNNRRVAERTAKTLRRVSSVTPTDEHERVMADIAQSKKVNPDPVIEKDDEFPALPFMKPTPGSPAALAAESKPFQANDDAEAARAKAHADAQAKTPASAPPAGAGAQAPAATPAPATVSGPPTFVPGA